MKQISSVYILTLVVVSTAIMGYCIWVPHYRSLQERLREPNAEIAQLERNLREWEARLPIEEQLRLKLQRFMEANIPEPTGKLRVELAPVAAGKAPPFPLLLDHTL